MQASLMVSLIVIFLLIFSFDGLLSFCLSLPTLRQL
jgi:hypothetical protein